MGYITPCDAPVSDDYNGHVARKSKEPGTDYACAYGTPLRAPEAGTIVYIDTNNNGAEGRRIKFDLVDGRRASFIHLSAIGKGLNKTFEKGEIIAFSGASGFGKDWYYGPHVHLSLWERGGMAYADTIDFELYLDSDNESGAGKAPEDDNRKLVEMLPTLMVQDNGDVWKMVEGVNAKTKEPEGQKRRVKPAEMDAYRVAAANQGLDIDKLIVKGVKLSAIPNAPGVK